MHLTIEEILRKRNIRWLCHFTPKENLDRILEEGLLTRDRLNDAIFTDNSRYDRNSFAICLSITKPNDWMMKKKMSQGYNFVMLLIDPSILKTKECLFFPHNAATSCYKYMDNDVFKGADALENLFSNRVEYQKSDGYTYTVDRETSLNKCEPTSSQAEVQCLDDIDLKYITHVIDDQDAFFSYKKIEYIFNSGERLNSAPLPVRNSSNILQSFLNNSLLENSDLNINKIPSMSKGKSQSLIDYADIKSDKNLQSPSIKENSAKAKPNLIPPPNKHLQQNTKSSTSHKKLNSANQNETNIKNTAHHTASTQPSLSDNDHKESKPSINSTPSQNLSPQKEKAINSEPVRTPYNHKKTKDNNGFNIFTFICLWVTGLIIVPILILLFIKSDFFQNHIIQNYNYAKESLRQIYKENPNIKEFFCSCNFSWEGNKGVVDLKSCGYKIRKNKVRAERIEMAHIMPAYAFGKHLQCWKTGGRNNCRNYAEFNIMEGDMHNIQPVVGEINGDRSNYRYSEFTDQFNQYGKCEFAVDSNNRKIQPREEIKGAIGRTYLYMASKHGLQLAKEEKKLMEAWDQLNPPSEWECKRNNMIKKIQGNDNPFITEKCLNL